MILFFTGTGNSEYVAKKIGKEIGEEPVNLFEKIRSQDYTELNSETPYIICAPTYAWEVPTIVRDWMKKAPFCGNKEMYFVLTCGSSAGGAGIYAKMLCEEMGMKYKGLAPIVMPENYIAMFNAPDETEAKQIVKKAENSIQTVISCIKEGKDIPEKILPGSKYFSKIINDIFFNYFVKDKKFVVSKKCTGCGMCEKVCPLSNVKLDDKTKKPVWQGNCTHCMACICKCPAEAIEYGRASVGKPRYKCPL